MTGTRPTEAPVPATDRRAGESAARLSDAIAEAATTANEDLQERDRSGTFSEVAWARCARAGLLGLTVPVKYGGLGLGVLRAMEALEHFGRVCEDAGLVFAVNSVLWSCTMPILWFGERRQRDAWLPALCDGSVIAGNAITEPGAGSDVFALSCEARHAGDRYVVSGSKTLISNAPVADVFLVYARTSDNCGPFGISVFLIDADASGVTRGPALVTMGLRTATIGAVEFRDCAVAESQMLGEPGSGAAIFTRAITWERACVLATAVGAMERQLERAVARANERRQFGGPIGRFQTIREKLADMRVRADASRLLLRRWAKAQDAGHDEPVWASIAKLFTSESLIESSMSAGEIFGGCGYVDDHPAERELRDALASRVYAGTSAIQREIIARAIGLP